MEKKYFASWIKQAADQVYGKKIAHSTWRKWLRIFGVRSWERCLTSEQSVMLLTYAHLRKLHPNREMGVIAVKKYLQQLPNGHQSLKEQVDNALLMRVSGKELPHVIRQYTGKQVSLRTLYRWASKHQLDFAASKKIEPQQVTRWLEIAS